jgi:hypothetical protein
MGCSYNDPLLSRWLAKAGRLRWRGLSLPNLRVRAGQLDGALLRYSPPHQAIIRRDNNMASLSFKEAFELPGGDPAVYFRWTDASFPRELADRLSIGVFEFLHRVALGIDQDSP